MRRRERMHQGPPQFRVVLTGRRRHRRLPRIAPPSARSRRTNASARSLRSFGLALPPR